VLICYLSIKEIPKINAIEIFNTVIIEGNSEQQKLCILTLVGSKHHTFTESTSKGMLKYE
jgi:hypothetical protein